VIDDLLRRLTSAPYRPVSRCFVVTAHPDDEAIGLGTRLPYLPDVQICLVTDGAPRGEKFFRRRMGLGPAKFTEIRKNEMTRSLHHVGVASDRIHDFGHPDREAINHLTDISRRLVSLFRSEKPQIVFTHPYEGGHPDHDTVAAAVAISVHSLGMLGDSTPCVCEFSSYFLGSDGQTETASFVPSEKPEYVCVLNGREKVLKRMMFQEYSTQKKTLELFPIEHELLREAPSYNFFVPPNRGAVLYERYNGDIHWNDWHEKIIPAVYAVTAELGIDANKVLSKLGREARSSDAEPT